MIERPAEISPMFTDGRYIYIISQWAKETGGSDSNQNDDNEDEEEQDENVKTEKKAARYGIDIFDPLKNFEHVRGVELKYSETELKRLIRKDKKKVYAPMNLDVMKEGSFLTNGEQLWILVPS
jgi:hypothetical protein